MYATSTFVNRRTLLTAWIAASTAALILLVVNGQVLSSAGAAPAVAAAADPVPAAPEGHASHASSAAGSKQPPPRIIVEPPKPEPLARGVAILQFRTENLQVVPVFGPAAAAVSPRIGHLHVTLDDTPWHWVHTSRDPIIVAPLPAGPHSITIELADANHAPLAREVVKFEVPQR